MSTFRKLLILCVTVTLFSAQAQAFPGAATPTAQPETTAAANFTKGNVIETMDAASYTYLHLQNEDQKFWAAIPASQVKVGEEVEIAPGAEMKNFSSKSLGRTFESIIFSSGLIKR